MVVKIVKTISNFVEFKILLKKTISRVSGEGQGDLHNP